ncbi:hypothetical protein [Anaerotruncus colihominis]|uniref:hypothetical protein n=1 Tax=Anaerotruncus colihominis TaxID=169435 RepID=UPI0013A6663F|nr:hypothetical protein [Anaerotruncus colihominis]
MKNRRFSRCIVKNKKLRLVKKAFLAGWTRFWQNKAAICFYQSEKIWDFFAVRSYKMPGKKTMG